MLQKKSKWCDLLTVTFRVKYDILGELVWHFGFPFVCFLDKDTLDCLQQSSCRHKQTYRQTTHTHTHTRSHSLHSHPGRHTESLSHKHIPTHTRTLPHTHTIPIYKRTDTATHSLTHTKRPSYSNRHTPPILSHTQTDTTHLLTPHMRHTLHDVSYNQNMCFQSDVQKGKEEISLPIGVNFTYLCLNARNICLLIFKHSHT